MNEEFEDWFDQAISDNLFELTAPSAQHKAALAAWTECERRKSVKSKKAERRFACHIDIGHSDPECVLDTGNYQDCTEARLLKEEGRGKTDCEFWNLVED